MLIAAIIYEIATIHLAPFIGLLLALYWAWWVAAQWLGGNW